MCFYQIELHSHIVFDRNTWHLSHGVRDNTPRSPFLFISSAAYHREYCVIGTMCFCQIESHSHVVFDRNTWRLSHSVRDNTPRSPFLFISSAAYHREHHVTDAMCFCQIHGVC